MNTLPHWSGFTTASQFLCLLIDTLQTLLNMALRRGSSERTVSLTDPMLYSGYGSIQVTYGEYEDLKISMRRTIRVPDTGSSYDLPPDCGAFPLYSINDFKHRLPENMTAKGGIFVPIYGGLCKSHHQFHGIH